MTVEVIRDADRFKDLRNDWNALLDGSNTESVFLTWEWLYYWWLHFSDNKELFILLIKNGEKGNLAGIAPFCIQKDKLFNIIPMRKLKFLGTGKAASDFLDFIIKPGMEKEVTGSVYKYLDSNADKWDIIDIEDINEDSVPFRMLSNLAGERYRIIESGHQICPYIKLSASYEEFLQSLSPNMRQGLRRKTKRLEAEGAIRFTINDEAENIKENVSTLFSLHRKRFNSKNSKTAFRGSDVEAFHQDIASTFLSKKWLKLYSVFHRDRAIASLYAFKYKGRLFYYQSGFDTDFKDLSLGTVLFGHAIKDSINDGLSEFHYLRGDEGYKFRWTKTVKKTKSYSLINGNYKSRLYGAFIYNKLRLKNILSNTQTQYEDKEI